MKTAITLVLVSIVLFFIAGCGPGQPFEIERMQAPQPDVTAQVACANPQ